MPNNDWELAALNKDSFAVTYGKDEDIASFMERFTASKVEPVQEG
jgi:hypothetical protein